MRYSTRVLLLVFMIVSVACAAMRYPHPLIGSIFTTVTFLMVLVCAALAILRRDESKAFWIGCFIFGGGYFAFVMLADRASDPLLRAISGASGLGASRALSSSSLITTQLLVLADSFMQSIRDPFNSTPAVTTRSATALGIYGDQATMAFIAIGQAVFTLVFGLFGGWLGRQFGRNGKARVFHAALSQTDENP